MKLHYLKIQLGITFLLLTILATAQSKSTAIIPEPVNIEMGKCTFKVTPKTSIIFESTSKELSKLADLLTERLHSELPAKSVTNTFPKKNYILLRLTPDANANPEGYELKVDKKSITISATNGKGIFYGIQTLFQLLPAEVESQDLTKEQVNWKVPVCSIKDYPRFPYRGIHLDVSRHFFTVEFIKKYIDLMAMYKFNTFHWHLTDDQGWRLEIKKYPLLTEIGSQRKSSPVGRNESTDNISYGGYYTQDDAREIVEYARQRYVAVIPEIEMPGHSQAVLAAYPELSCTEGPFEVWTEWGITEEIFCAGKEETFHFLEDVLTEVMNIFPSKYIHIGGDEAPKTRWDACPRCQKRIADEGLKDSHELQSYFIRRMEKFLNQNGRQIIGWDEILEGGLAPGATVMSWRGMEGGIEAAKMGHDVIMTPGTPLYLNHYQGSPLDEPTAIGGYNPIKSVYLFEPIPAELSQEEGKHILGAQANLWTEYIADPALAEYMLYPRALALAEVTWSPKSLRNWDDFSARLLQHFDRLEAREVNFSKSAFKVSIQMIYDSLAGQMKVNLSSDFPEAGIWYNTLINGENAGWKKYKKPFTLVKAGEIQAELEIAGKKTGKISKKSIIVHDAFGRLPVLHTPFSSLYAASGPITLTDGTRALPSTYRYDWLGYSGEDASVTIDLGKEIMIKNVNIGFLYNPGDWIFLPAGVEISLSQDGINFNPAPGMHPDFITPRKPAVIDYNVVQINTKARYIKVIAKNIGVCPPGHSAAGEKAWLFLDEIMVNQSED